MSRPESKARSSSTTRAMLRSSLNAGTIAIRLGSPGSGNGDTALEPERGQQPARAVTVGVLVEDPLSGAASQLRRLRPVSEQLAVGGDGFLRRANDEQLAAGLEP